MKVRVGIIRDESMTIKSFELQSVDGTALPLAAAGSHVRVEIADGDGNAASQRHYSVVSGTNDSSRYEIAVLLEKDGHGGSRFMHERVQEGDVLEVSSPRNDFPLAEGAAHTILIAGGIGITPILAMLRQLEVDEASFEVHYAARSRARMAYPEEVVRLAGDRSTFYVSDEDPGSRINLSELLASPLPGSHVYVCGPRSLIEGVRAAASENGWPPSSVHFETFAAGRGPDDREIRVELSYTGTTLTVAPNQTVLDALLDASVWASFECRRGECGMCVTQVLEGEPDHRDVCLTEAQRAQAMCTCVSRAKGPRLVLAL